MTTSLARLLTRSVRYSTGFGAEFDQDDRIVAAGPPSGIDTPQAVVHQPGGQLMAPNTFRFSQQQIEEFCRRWKVAELAVTGSQTPRNSLHGQEIGLTVRFDPTAEWTLSDRMSMQRELRTISGMDVNLLPHKASQRVDARQRGSRILYDA